MEGESLGFKEQLGLLEGKIRVSEETLADVQQTIDKLDGELKGSEIPGLNKKADAASLEIKRLQDRLTGIDPSSRTR
jgi:hypothetical protein